MSDFLGYLANVSGGEQRQTMAKIIGVSPSTVTRWDPTRADYYPPKFDHVITLARHYQRPPIEALIAAGLITPEDARGQVVERPLASIPHAELLRELGQRLDRMSVPTEKMGTPYREDPRPDDYDLAAGRVARPDDQHAD